MMIYHNITPPEYFRGINDGTYFLTREGRAALKRAGKNIDLVLAVSPFNQRELIEAGFAQAKVLPLLIDFEQFDQPADDNTVVAYNDGKKNLLFVGRILPNKKQEDIIRVFYYYKRFLNPESRLFLVGTPDHAPAYQSILEELVEKLELDDVVFAGSVSQPLLQSYFKTADLFLCMSEHEGFCVPLLEAMYKDLPVLAYASSAVVETLSGASVLVREKQYLKIAALIDVIMNDTDIRQSIITGQQRRLRQFRRDEVEKQLKQYIEQLTGT